MFLNTIFASNQRQIPKGLCRLIVDSMNLRNDTLLTLYTWTQTCNLLRHQRTPIPLGQSEGYFVVERKFLIEGNYLPSAGLELGHQIFSDFLKSIGEDERLTN